MTDNRTLSALDAFDKAVAAELPCVSVVPYNSHDICKWFAGNVRQRLTALVPSGAAEALEGKAVPAWIDDALDFEPDASHTIPDMANVGYALMQALPKGYSYLDSPAEIVNDLLNQIGDLKAAATPPAAGVSHGEAVETAWLVERHDDTPIYYLYFDWEGPVWTKSPNEACRFARRVDAEMAAAGAENLEVRIVQHQWSAQPEEPK